MLKLLLYIGTGGFLGSVSRFLVSRYVQQVFLSAFPYGTLIVNVLGCLLIGVLYGVFDRNSLVAPEWRMFLVAGFCGGFTTFSAFSIENVGLLRDGDYLYFFLYTSLSIILGLGATFSGIVITKYI